MLLYCSMCSFKGIYSRVSLTTLQRHWCSLERSALAFEHMTSVSLEDGHDNCPSCIGVEHLNWALTEDACSNSAYIPLAMRTTRLVRFDAVRGVISVLPASGTSVCGPSLSLNHCGHIQEKTPCAKRRQKGVETWPTRWMH